VDTFYQLCEVEGVKPQDVVVIDDMQDNLAIAKQAGAKTVWIHADVHRQKHGWDIAAVSFVDLVIK
jgi:putative hydrolase of the HAD superfamily